MGNKTKIFFSLVIATYFFSSCVRRGCMDQDGENFEPRANTPCSCCYFYGKAYIWYKDPFYATLGGVSKLYYYADGKLVGESTKALSTYNYYQSPPTVNPTHFVVYKPSDGNILTVNLEDKKLKTSQVIIKDQSENIRWQGPMNFQANKIITVELF